MADTFSASKDVLVGTTTLQWHTTLPLQLSHLSEVALDTGMARPMAIPRPMSRQNESCPIPRYIFGYRDIRYFGSIAMFDVDTIFRTILLCDPNDRYKLGIS